MKKRLGAPEKPIQSSASLVPDAIQTGTLHPSGIASCVSVQAASEEYSVRQLADINVAQRHAEADVSYLKNVADEWMKRGDGAGTAGDCLPWGEGRGWPPKGGKDVRSQARKGVEGRRR